MAGAGPYHHIGSTDPAMTRRAEQALARLRTSARHPMRDLTTVAACWFTPASCFGTPGLASPTREGVETVARFLDHANEQVAVAAVGAMRAAIVVWSHPGGVMDAEPWAATQPEAVVHLASALASPRAVVRLAVARLLAQYPSAALHGALRARLDDPVFSVRWLAVSALAMHDNHEALFEVLRHSLPHDRSGQAAPSHPFWAAARALGRIAEAEALLTR